MATEPYVGLRPYGIADKDRFHGRDRECYDVSVLWRGCQLLVLYGPSGVGKTSLLQAGVILQLDQDADVLPVGRVYHSSAVHTILSERNDYDFALLSSWSPDTSPTALAGLRPVEFLTQRTVRTDQYGDPLPVLAAIDQFEELFMGFPHRQRSVDQFIDHLADAIENLPTLRLLIVIREEALAKLLSYESRLAQRSRARFPILPLARAAALEAVTGPVRGTGRSFASGVAERLVDELLTTDVISRAGTTRLPVESVDPMNLQAMCIALWRALPEDVTTVTEEHLRHHDDIRTVDEFCARMIADVANEHQIPERLLYQRLEHTFITKLGSRRTAYEGVSETGSIPNPIVRALERRSILQFKLRSGSRWYELQHDRLIEPIRATCRSLAKGTVLETIPAELLRAAEAALIDEQLEVAVEYAEEAVDICGGGGGAGDDDFRTRAEAEAFLGNVAFLRHDLAEAEEHFLRAAGHFETLQDETAVGRVFAMIGRLLLARRPYAEAVDALHVAVTRLPGDIDVLMDLARALWFSGELRGAAAVFGQILTIAPDTVEALAGRGQIRVEQNDAGSALEDLDNLRRLQPDIGRRAEVRAARALALARLDRIEEAVPEADAAVGAAPESGPVLLCAAMVAQAANEPTRTTNLLHRAREAQAPRLLPHQLEMADRLLAA